MVALFVFLTFVALIAVDLVVSHFRKRVPAYAIQQAPRAVLSYPLGLFFSKGHTWASLAGENEVQVGLGDFVSNLVGNIDEISVAEGEIKAGETLFTVKQKDKILSLASPVNGKILKANDAVLSDPNRIRERPLSRQWIASIESPDPSADLRLLQMANEAKSWVLREAARFVDSYSTIFGKPGVAPSLADGGTLVEGALSSGDEDAWDNFQKQFLS